MFSDPFGLDSVGFYGPDAHRLLNAYEGAKADFLNCARTCEAGQASDALTAYMGLRGAEGAPEWIKIRSGVVQGGTVANKPAGTGRNVTIDLSGSTIPASATLGSVLAHDVIEGRIGIENGNFDFADTKRWGPIHDSVVRGIDDVLNRINGLDSRTSRSPGCNTRSTPNPYGSTPVC